MLTVDFARFPITAGERVLDLGCGGGRHAFEALRRGGRVVAVDTDRAELAAVAAMFAAMDAAGEVPPGGSGQTAAGDATALPFPDGSFDRVIAAEVLEHIPADQDAISEIARVLRPGGTAAVTVPAWLPERICWGLSDDYHNVPGGHLRIFTRGELAAKLARAGLRAGGHHYAHALHSPYWWLKCAVGVHNDSHPLARAYHQVLVWQIMKDPALLRAADRALGPLIGKSVVIYAAKPAPGRQGPGGQAAGGPPPGTPPRGSARRLPALPPVLTPGQILATGRSIAAVQQPDGSVGWPDGHVDAWNHTECLMALSACGLREPARRGYDWLRATQRPDGSWPKRWQAGTATDSAAESNHAAYPAVGVWHELLISQDERFADRMWPVVRAGINFALSLQQPRGEIVWQAAAGGAPASYALLAGCSSMHQALRCAIALAEHVGEPQPDWELAAGQLAHAVAAHPEAFADKSRFSMDWYYPVLGGPVRGAAARAHLQAGWDTFVVGGLGVRCVSDQPWVTGAETCELAIALDAAGDRPAAAELMAQVQHLRCADGSYWTGWQYANSAHFPNECSSWTAAAVILAADALSRTSAGSAIFADAAARWPAAAPADAAVCGCADPAAAWSPASPAHAADSRENR